jgi:hypothetical protein
MPVEVAFACASCGFAARALIEGEGVGTATSYIVLDREHADEAAADEAVAEARHDAKVIGSIMPCPKCQQRSRAAVVSFIANAVLSVLGFVAFGALSWWLVGTWFGWFMLGLSLVMAITTAMRRRRRYQLASTLVIKIQPEAVLPRAQARGRLPAPPPTQAPAAIERTPASEEPRTLR